MFKKMWIFLGILAVAVVVYAVNYPVTSVRDSDGDQLLINADGSLTATIDPSVTGNFTVSGQGSFGTVWDSNTFRVNGIATFDNQANMKHANVTSTATIVGDLLTRGHVKVFVDKYIDFGGGYSQLIANSARSTMDFKFDATIPLVFIPNMLTDRVNASTWTTSGLTLAPGSQLNTSNLNVTSTSTFAGQPTFVVGTRSAWYGNSDTSTRLYMDATSMNTFFSNDSSRSTWTVSGLTMNPGAQINTSNANVTGTMTVTGVVSAKRDINILSDAAGDFTYLYIKHTSNNANSGAGIRLANDVGGDFYLGKYSSGKAGGLASYVYMYEPIGMITQSPIYKFSDLGMINLSTWTPGVGLTMSPGSYVAADTMTITGVIKVSSGAATNTVVPTMTGCPAASANVCTWITILLKDANGTNFPAYIPVWR